MFRDITLGTIWIGRVINTNDPLKLGRVKVAVFGKYDKLDEEVIPWAIPYNQLSTGSVVIPKVNELVNVFFENGNTDIPLYVGEVKPNDEFLEKISDSYPKVWSLIYDTKLGEDGKGTEGDKRTLEIYYTESQGLIIKKNESFIQISNEDESILIQNGTAKKSIHINDDTISLGSEKKSAEPAVLADTLEKLLNAFIDEIGLLVIPTPAGPAPVNLAPTWEKILKFKTDWEKFKSEIVTLD